MHDQPMAISRREPHGLVWLLAALIAVGALPRLAVAQSIIDLNPSHFAPGTNVSNAFAGATLSAMSFVADGTDPATGINLWAPSYSAVYANGSYFTDSATPVSGNWLGASDWGPMVQQISGDCFKACLQSNFPQGVVTNGNADLLVSFDRPVNFASALQIGDDANGDFIEAFNSSDQLVATCLPPIAVGQPIGHYGCYSVVDGAFLNYAELTSVAAPGISRILVGGFNEGGSVGAIFAVTAPEIDITSASSGVALLLGGLLVMRGRRARY